MSLKVEKVDLPDPDSQQPNDQAMKSLTDALQVSFKLLSVLMVLFLALFLLTGIESVNEQEQGVCKLFGKVVRVTKPGLVYNWPFPIGSIEKVNTQEQNIFVDDFWLNIPSKYQDKPLQNIQYLGTGLNPVADGYLLTADLKIVHVKLLCKFKIENPLAFIESFEQANSVVKDAVKQATVKAAALRTADSIVRGDSTFLFAIQKNAQDYLNNVSQTGLDKTPAIKITGILFQEGQSKTWPIGAYDSYLKAQAAVTEKNARIETAKANAIQRTKVCGRETFVKLAGEVWEVSPLKYRQRTEKGTYKGNPYNLLGQLEIEKSKLARLKIYANDKSNQAKIKKTQSAINEINLEIDRILEDATTTGKVSELLSTARSNYTQKLQEIKALRDQFVKLLPEYNKDPSFFRSQLWVQTFSSILSAPGLYKLWVTPGKNGMQLQLPSDPILMKKFRDMMRKKNNSQSNPLTTEDN